MQNMIPLSNETLPHLPTKIVVPGYDRSRLTAGIAHIGVGNFHRTHQAVYVDRCLHLPDHSGWGIIGISLGRDKAAQDKVDAFRRQDCLYTVTEYDPHGDHQTRVIGAMIGFLSAANDQDLIFATLASPDIRIVTMTITEKNYNLDEETGEFRLDNPEIVADLARSVPETVFGVLVEGLERRRQAGVSPFAVVSCDNLRGNGDTIRKGVVAFARAKNPELASWIEQNAGFPNGMVDRIAPTVTAVDSRRLKELSGIDDHVPVMSESFIQWVVEDHFPAGRPAFESVGVELRDDIGVFEAAKGRILNAAHVMLSYPGLLSGYRLVQDAMADSALRGFIDRFLTKDAIPLIEGPAGVSLYDYKDIILDRFSNPAVRDQLIRIAQDGSAKIPTFHRKTMEQLITTQGNVSREAFFLACFGRYLGGCDDKGETLNVSEPTLSEVDRRELNAADGLGLLRTTPFAAMGLDRYPPFVAAYQKALSDISRYGVITALKRNAGHDW